MDGEDEPMHCYITAPTPDALKKAVEKVRGLIYLATECPEAENELKRIQLRELAALNGTLREEEVVRCKNCGNIGHRYVCTYVRCMYECTYVRTYVCTYIRTYV